MSAESGFPRGGPQSAVSHIPGFPKLTRGRRVQIHSISVPQGKASPSLHLLAGLVTYMGRPAPPHPTRALEGLCECVLCLGPPQTASLPGLPRNRLEHLYVTFSEGVDTTYVKPHRLGGSSAGLRGNPLIHQLTGGGWGEGSRSRA